MLGTRSGGACTRRRQNKWRPRKPIRLPVDAYLAGEPFLLTVCTASGQDLLSEKRYGRAAHSSMLKAAEKTGATLWCGVVMPDHVHLLVSAREGKTPLNMGACFKRLTTIAVRNLGYEGTLWQRRMYDRGIRTEFNNDPEIAVLYVLENPVRRGLTPSWKSWSLSYIHPDIDTFA